MMTVAQAITRRDFSPLVPVQLGAKGCCWMRKSLVTENRNISVIRLLDSHWAHLSNQAPGLACQLYRPAAVKARNRDAEVPGAFLHAFNRRGLTNDCKEDC